MSQKELPTQEQVSEYLDELRESGVTNMFGAAPYVKDEFGCSINQARDFLSTWMNSFEE